MQGPVHTTASTVLGGSGVQERTRSAVTNWRCTVKKNVLAGSKAEALE